VSVRRIADVARFAGRTGCVRAADASRPRKSETVCIGRSRAARPPQAAVGNPAADIL